VLAALKRSPHRMQPTYDIVFHVCIRWLIEDKTRKFPQLTAT
jgi:hypothetical protein